MGVLSDLRAFASMAESMKLNPQIRSPYSGDLAKIVYEGDPAVFGTGYITRAEAMTIPGVYRARGILLTLLADKPLNAWARDVLVSPQPSFTQRTPGILGPWQRMARTIDDLIFYPYSLWLTERGAERSGRRDILNAIHCPYELWQINAAGLIEIQNADGGWDVADEDEVILIPGPSEGLIVHASRTLSGAADLERAWVSRAKTPAPLTELHVTDDVALDDEEIIATRDAWVSARRAADGAVAVTPANIEVIDHGQADAVTFEGARNASRIDIAHFFNMPGAIVDATTASASLTYVTQEGTRTSIYDLTLPYWARPIESRLSQDDICPAGQSMRFDFSTLAPGQPNVITED